MIKKSCYNLCHSLKCDLKRETTAMMTARINDGLRYQDGRLSIEWHLVSFVLCKRGCWNGNVFIILRN